VIAAHTPLVVIGVPIDSKLRGLDSLLSTVQMPKGVPVATVAIDNATNAALLAVGCLALGDRRLARALQVYKRKLTATTRSADRRLQAKRR
jgi:5-(carboxyamino)imidazole ribonucleotide mutase